MSIEHLGQLFAKVNPNAGTNPDGNCMHCAVETAKALVEGRRPKLVDGSIGSVANNRIPLLVKFSDRATRQTRVLLFLQRVAPAGVYAVDAEDHAYNFVVLSQPRRIFLVDSNQHVYREVAGLGDFL